MGLVAADLSFRYPEIDKDVLRHINLTIRPGTTLAIVGLNGGGKTTLVKALMGLYDSHGSLLLNDHSIASFDPASVHRRTSCLFQDYCRCSLSLRENVGIGLVSQAMEQETVKQAIIRVGAEELLQKVGMEGNLNRYGTPNALAAEDIQFVLDHRPSDAARRPPSAGTRGKFSTDIASHIMETTSQGGRAIGSAF
jgi:ABC-type multidrug transport system fused ATPase/permease subunit